MQFNQYQGKSGPRVILFKASFSGFISQLSCHVKQSDILNCLVLLHKCHQQTMTS